MIVLMAYYAGTVRPEDQHRFDDYVRNVHLPLVATWPRLRRLRLLKNSGEPYLGEAPRYYQAFELTFDNEQDLAAVLASEEREETKRRSIADRPIFRALFSGEVRHATYETTAFRTPAPGAPQDTLLRCASYFGTVAPQNRETFDRYIREIHLPDVAAWPHLNSLRLAKNDERVFNAEASAYYQSFDLGFLSQDDMDACMASDARKETRRISAQDIGKFKGLFEGEVHHTNYTVRDFALRPGKVAEVAAALAV